MNNFVTYQVALTPENAAKIDAINHVMLGTAQLQVAATTTEQPAEAKAAATTTEQPAEEFNVKSFEDFKKAAKAAKKDHGEEFAKQVLISAGVEVTSTLGRAVSKAGENQYDSIIAEWVAGPPAVEDDGLEEDDGFGDDEPTVTAEAVKTALKAYAKDTGREEAKAVMAKHGAASLSKVDDCTPAQLQAMFAELV
tara:strand:+ start:35284 stop:35868 length:585 start_codon:yes stop_codon:yes gene_type:complete